MTANLGILSEGKGYDGRPFWIRSLTCRGALEILSFQLPVKRCRLLSGVVQHPLGSTQTVVAGVIQLADWGDGARRIGH